MFIFCCTVVLQALLRRLEKRILVPLPDVQARRAMLGSLLGQRVAADVDLDGLAAATAGYSGKQELNC
jgi:katanin p60 ATPase-containing subunit A1